MNKQQGQNQQDKNPQSQQDKQQSQSGDQRQQGSDRDLGTRDPSQRKSGSSDLNQGSQQGQRDRSQDKSR